MSYLSIVLGWALQCPLALPWQVLPKSDSFFLQYAHILSWLHGGEQAMALAPHHRYIYPLVLTVARGEGYTSFTIDEIYAKTKKNWRHSKWPAGPVNSLSLNSSRSSCKRIDLAPCILLCMTVCHWAWSICRGVCAIFLYSRHQC